MSILKPVNRRKFIARTAVTTAVATMPASLLAQESMRTRTIPGSNESLPVVGMGAPWIFFQPPEEGKALPKSVLQAMVDLGGKVIDTPAFYEANEFGQTFIDEPVLGELLTEMELQQDLFLIGKVTVRGKSEGIRHLEKTERLLNKRPMDLLMVHNMRGMDDHWPTLKDWKAAGRARYIGVSLTRQQTYDGLERFMKNENPDFVMTGYSIAHQQAAERILPLAADMGTAVIGVEPFKALQDGAYFSVVAGKPLPEWAAEFDCETWAQFSLKYILSNPAITCVVTETSKVDHVIDNMRAGYGRLPNEATRKRMSEYIQTL